MMNTIYKLQRVCTEKGIVPGANIYFEGETVTIPEDGYKYEYFVNDGNETLTLNGVVVYRSGVFAEPVTTSPKTKDSHEDYTSPFDNGCSSGVLKVYFDFESGSISNTKDSENFQEYFLVPKSKRGDFPDLSGFRTDSKYLVEYEGEEGDDTYPTTIIAEFTDIDEDTFFLTSDWDVVDTLVGKIEDKKENITLEELFEKAGLDITKYELV